MTVTDHFRTPCCYRPIIQEIGVVSQEDSKSNALLHYRQGSSSPQSTSEALTQPFFKKTGGAAVSELLHLYVTKGLIVGGDPVMAP